MTEAKSAQPQLPALDDCPRCKGSGQVESISFVNSSKRVTRGCNLCHGTGKLPRDMETLERQLLSAMAENESLKAQLQIAACECSHDEACALFIRAVKAEAERDKALEVIRAYRKTHPGCCDRIAGLVNETMLDGRCPTCIKADALLSREEK